VLENGQRMAVFDHPDLSKTTHVITLNCRSIGERGALALAAELIRGSCPMIETLDLTRNQIQTRGLGRLLHGMRIANLMSLRECILRGNDLTARALEYLRDAFTGGCFPSLEVGEVRQARWYRQRCWSMLFGNRMCGRACASRLWVVVLNLTMSTVLLSSVGSVHSCWISETMSWATLVSTWSSECLCWSTSCT
jgi:hypothetical protein